jgi:hypothetical protein
LSGRLKYDINYKVALGVQNLHDPTDKKDTSFNIVFFNTEIIPSRIKPTVSGTIWVDEAETVNFKIVCETGSFPVDNIMMMSSVPIRNYAAVQKCGDDFSWTPGYDFAKDTDSCQNQTGCSKLYRKHQNGYQGYGQRKSYRSRCTESNPGT